MGLVGPVDDGRINHQTGEDDASPPCFFLSNRCSIERDKFGLQTGATPDKRKTGEEEVRVFSGSPASLPYA